MYEIYPQTKVSENNKNVILQFDGVNTSALAMSEAKRLCDSSCKCAGFVVTTDKNGKQNYEFYSNVAQSEFINTQSTMYLKKGNSNYYLLMGMLFVVLLAFIWWCRRSNY